MRHSSYAWFYGFLAISNAKVSYVNSQIAKVGYMLAVKETSQIRYVWHKILHSKSIWILKCHMSYKYAFLAEYSDIFVFEIWAVEAWLKGF